VHSSDPIRFSQPLRKVVLASTEAAPVFSNEDIEAAKREAYQRGCADASAMVEQHLVEQRHEVVHLQQKTFAALSAQHQALAAQMRAVMPELTMEAVRRVLAKIEIDRDLVVRIVEEVLSEIAEGRQAIEVTLSEHDLKLIEGNEARFREKYPDIEFRTDAEMQPGDCVVRSRHGAIDARLSTKLKTVEQAFR
jgi:flagellar assembly protein FliH